MDLPLLVVDAPDLEHRGIMIDSSRHYLSVEMVKQTIDSLMYNKMNVLHWHIVDEDYFPLVVPDLPGLASAGAHDNQTYSPQQVQDVVLYAMKRGVRVIPEIDSPAHAEAWGRSLNGSDFIMKCGEPYFGQIDPTMDKAYNWTSQIWSHVLKVFPDQYVHAGGDEVDQGCWNRRPAIKQFMQQHNLSNYFDLQVFWRVQEKVDFRKLSSKPMIYWYYDAEVLPSQEDDVIQWWGGSGSFKKAVGNRTNKIILSFYDKLYIDIGYGGRMGGNYGGIERWDGMFECDYVYSDIKGEVIGAEATLWS